jgi:PAS domain-containing protein
MFPQHQWSFFSPREATEENPGESSSPARLPCEQLFAASSEAVLILDAASNKILQANPAAAALLRTTRTALGGSSFPAAFESSNSAEIQRRIRLARSSGSSDVMAVRALGGGIDLSARVSLVRAGSHSYLLVRLAPALSVASSGGAGTGSGVLEAIDCAPVGFLIAEVGFHVDYANRAFMEMAGIHSESEVRGSPLTRWLRLSEADLGQLAQQLSDRQSTGRLTTQLCSGGSRARRVEICAVPVPDGEHTWWGFTVSELPRLN